MVINVVDSPKSTNTGPVYIVNWTMHVPIKIPTNSIEYHNTSVQKISSWLGWGGLIVGIPQFNVTSYNILVCQR